MNWFRRLRQAWRDAAAEVDAKQDALAYRALDRIGFVRANIHVLRPEEQEEVSQLLELIEVRAHWTREDVARRRAAAAIQ